jgi:hypothetical protein
MGKDWKGDANGVFKTLGASNHNKDGERESNDYYATDPIAIDKLRKEIDLPEVIYEPACGSGHLALRLIEYGHEVISSDLVDRGHGKGGVDFLKTESLPDDRITCILTNPPYKYATEFVVHALKLLPEGGLCCMFLRTLFLEGKTRFERIFSITPPYCVLQSSERIRCAKNGEFDGSAGCQSYAWFVWRKGWYGEPTIRWI